MPLSFSVVSPQLYFAICSITSKVCLLAFWRELSSHLYDCQPYQSATLACVVKRPKYFLHFFSKVAINVSLLLSSKQRKRKHLCTILHEISVSHLMPLNQLQTFSLLQMEIEPMPMREYLAHNTKISFLQSQYSAAVGFPGTKDNLPLQAGWMIFNSSAQGRLLQHIKEHTWLSFVNWSKVLI